MDLPTVCTLTESELRERRKTKLDSIREAAIDVTPIPEGYAYRFPLGAEMLSQLSHLVTDNLPAELRGELPAPDQVAKLLENISE